MPKKILQRIMSTMPRLGGSLGCGYIGLEAGASPEVDTRTRTWVPGPGSGYQGPEVGTRARSWVLRLDTKPASHLTLRC